MALLSAKMLGRLFMATPAGVAGGASIGSPAVRGSGAVFSVVLPCVGYPKEWQSQVVNTTNSPHRIADALCHSKMQWLARQAAPWFVPCFRTATPDLKHSLGSTSAAAPLFRCRLRALAARTCGPPPEPRRPPRADAPAALLSGPFHPPYRPNQHHMRQTKLG